MNKEEKHNLLREIGEGLIIAIICGILIYFGCLFS